MGRKKKQKEPGMMSRVCGAAWALCAMVWERAGWAGSATAGLMLVAVVALAVGYGPMKARAAAVRAEPVRLVIEWPLMADGERTWLDEATQEKLLRAAREQVSADVFDRGALLRVQRVLMESGWFAQEPTVRRGEDGVVQVSGVWRVPIGVVRAGGRDWLIAGSGERLDLDYPQDRSGLQVIFGVRSQTPAIGQRWAEHEAIASAIKLLAELREVPRSREQVYGVDISNMRSHGLVIVTERGNRVIWGGPVGVYTPGEVDTSVKLARLAESVHDGRARHRIDWDRTLIDIRTAVFEIDDTAQPTGNQSQQR